MTFSKIRYNSGVEIFKLKVEDSTGAVIDKWVVMKHDFPRLSNIIFKKYGLNKKKKLNEDLSWAI